MVTLLLCVIYICFVSLGIPDSLFGAAWPAIYREMNLPISWANFVTICCTTGTITASLTATRIIAKLGTGRVAAISTTLTALALFGFSVSGNMVMLCLMALPLGLGGGCIDTALNSYVALHYDASHMSFLHCAYGVGVSVSPFLMSLALDGGTWQGGYRLAATVQGSIALLAILSLPLWKKVWEIHNKKTGDGEENADRILSLKEMLKQPSMVLAGMVFYLSCSIEHTCGVWGSTYLVEELGTEPDTAAFLVMFYYIGLATGRLVSGLVSPKLKSWQIIGGGMGILAMALLLLTIPFPSAVALPLAVVGLFCVGFGNGPVFPNMMHLTPESFGRDCAASVMGLQYAFCYVGILVMPLLFGKLVEWFGTGIYGGYMLVLYVVMALVVWRLRRVLQKKKG